jgi:predicted nucleic acid-binding protein
MIKRLVSTVIVGAFLAGAAHAQATADNQCEQVALELARAAEAKQLSDDKLDRIEDLLGKMEDLCDDNRVAEAMAVARDIEAEINAQ